MAACGSGLHHEDVDTVDTVDRDAGPQADVRIADQTSGTDVRGGGADAAPNDATPNVDAPVVGPKRRIFVTSGTVKGGMNGIEGADAMCQTESGTVVVGFHAWLAVNGENPASRFADGSSYWLAGAAGGPDVLVAESRAVLASGGAIRTGINRTATGTTVANDCVWTGFLSDEDCDNWTRLVPGFGRTGRVGAVDATWTNDGTAKCAGPCHLYCVQD